LRILEAVRRQPPLRTPLDEATGSILAQDIVSPLDIPAWSNSAMDGYAARADDVRGASEKKPVRLNVIEEIPAGAFPERTVGTGECARIFTGAPLPEGADSVVRQEDTDMDREQVSIMSDRDAGSNIRLAGEDITRGSTVLRAGTELGPAEIGVLASLAVAAPLVHRRPRVGILASGDEIVDLDQAEEILSGRKVASSNTHTLRALIHDAGGVPVDLGIARDTRESFRSHLNRASDCDLLVTTAGISVGEHDYLREVLQELGADIRFWKLRMRPGAPVGFGLLGELPWIGLPGNPVSTMVTFELFVRPAIRTMSGHALPFRRMTEVTLAEDVVVRPRLQHFLRAIMEESETGPRVRLTGPQGSGILTSMVLANALLVLPEGQQKAEAGSSAGVINLKDPVFQAEPPF
ncbi:MAG: molybdopterin molybdotransferase MoeA, partial [Gemmatimonadales bacterium]